MARTGHGEDVAGTICKLHCRGYFCMLLSRRTCAFVYAICHEDIIKFPQRRSVDHPNRCECRVLAHNINRIIIQCSYKFSSFTTTTHTTYGCPTPPITTPLSPFNHQSTMNSDSLSSTAYPSVHHHLGLGPSTAGSLFLFITVSLCLLHR